MKVYMLACLLAICCAMTLAQKEAGLLFPFNQMEIEASKRDKAIAITQEYQAQEKELKENTSLSNSDRQKLRTANYHSYLKKMEDLLNKDQRKKARTMLVENDVKGLREKPAMPRYYDRLGLSEKQIAKAQELNLQQRIKTQTLYHTGNYTPKERSEEAKFINEEFTNKFNDLLTPEQRLELTELRKQGAAIAAMPVPPLFQKLNLSSTQTDKLKQILFERKTKLDNLNKDQSLAAEARQQQINELNTEANNSAEALLNKDQKIKLDDLLNEANYKMPAFYAPLDLTAEQQAKLKETLLWQAHETALIRQDTKLSAEQKQQRLAQVNADLQARFNAFMTPEQMSKLISLLREMQKAQPQKPQPQ